MSLHRYQHTSRSAAPESLRCWQVSLGEIGLGLVLLLCWHCSSRPLVCESVNDGGFCFVRQAKVQKKRVGNASAAHSPLTFHSIFQVALVPGESFDWNIWIFGILSRLLFSYSHQTVLSASGEALPGRTPLTPISTHHHHLSGSSQVLWSKGRKRVIPNDKLAV